MAEKPFDSDFLVVVLTLSCCFIGCALYVSYQVRVCVKQKVRNYQKRDTLERASGMSSRRR